MSRIKSNDGIPNIHTDKAEIPGFSRYFATSDGEVYSKNYNNTGRIGRMVGKATKDGCIELVLRDDNGYQKHVRKHRIIAMAFIPNPDNLPQVNHKDGIKSNCAPHNLEWSRSPSSMDAYKVPVIATNTKTGQVLRFGSIADAGRALNIGSQNIWACLNNMCKTSGGFFWKYERSDNNDHQ